MSVTISIPTALRSYTENQPTVLVEGDRVRDALLNFVEKHPDIKNHLYSESEDLRSFVNVYVNDEDIRYLNQQDTELQDGDVVTIVPAVAGGTNPTPGQQADADRPPRSVELSKEEIERYSRHLIIPDVGVSGQKKLKSAGVLIIGTGGLGSPLALYLAAAGVGRIGLVDFDVVDFTNLQRQIIHYTSDVGRAKLESAKEKINGINPHVEVDTYETQLTSDNALDILPPYDIIIDGTDNFPTRYLVNNACVLLGKPNVYGSIFRFEGQASVFWAERGPCYRCLYPEPPPPGLVPSCAEGGVLGILPGIIGVMQANEAVKLIMGLGDPLIGRLILYDALSMRFRELKLNKDPDCPVCGTHPSITGLIDYEQFCGIGTDQDRIMLESNAVITPVEAKRKMDQNNEIFILDVRQPHEYEICRIPTSTLIPLADIEKRIGELDRDKEIIVHCRSGMRSAKAVKFLREAGFKKAQNLEGGILAWADKVDSSMPKY